MNTNKRQKGVYKRIKIVINKILIFRGIKNENKKSI